MAASSSVLLLHRTADAGTLPGPNGPGRGTLPPRGSPDSGGRRPEHPLPEGFTPRPRVARAATVAGPAVLVRAPAGYGTSGAVLGSVATYRSSDLE